MDTTLDEFEAMVKELRLGLIHAARRLRRCGQEEAEDLASETVIVALERLAEYDRNSGRNGMKRWLYEILRRIVKREDRLRSRMPVTQPLSEMSETQLRPTECAADVVARTVSALPPILRGVAADWLREYPRSDIARRNHVHRNSVSAKIRLATETLRTRYSDVDDMRFAFSLFNSCAHRTVYRKPTDAWPAWRDNHPPDVRFPAQREAPDEAASERNASEYR